jgi:hypothetical protein
MKKPHILGAFVVFIVLSFFWLIYSFTQVDLNLTLSNNSLYQTIQNQLLQFGYYNRPASTLVLAILLVASFLCWLWIIKLTATKQLTIKHIWMLIEISGILILAYPAFSHDLFNYMFDARVVTKYGLDPRFFRALDFPFDTWTRFMHWTHRFYPYGPGWLYLTLIPSFLGFGKFTLTLLLFKVMFFMLHLANCWLIVKIVEKYNKFPAALALVFYALNPLVLIEGLISPHNEMAMVTFLLLSIHFLMKEKNASAIITLLISASTKYVSIILLPIFIWSKKLKIERFYSAAYFLWLLALIPLALSRQAYSWYVLPLIALGALSYQNRLIFALTFGLSALLFQYLPFSYFGDYSTTTNNLTVWVSAAGVCGLFIIGYIYRDWLVKSTSNFPVS